MRFLAILLALVLVYFFFLGPSPKPVSSDAGANPVSTSQSGSAQSANGSSFLKRPLDHAHEALDANRKRVSDEL